MTVTTTTQHYLDQMPFCYYTKDVDSTYTFVNKHVVEANFVKEIDEIIGKTDHELPWYATADQLREYDRLAMQNGSIFEMDMLTRSDGTTIPVLSSKSPIYDGNKIIGVGGIALEMCVDNYKNIMQLLSCTGLQLNNFLQMNKDKDPHFKYKNIEFSQRQAEIIGYLLRGYSSKMTAAKLGLSYRTIEFYIENIKTKLECNTRFEIVNKAFEYGFIDLMFMVFKK